MVFSFICSSIIKWIYDIKMMIMMMIHLQQLQQPQESRSYFVSSPSPSPSSAISSSSSSSILSNTMILIVRTKCIITNQNNANNNTYNDNNNTNNIPNTMQMNISSILVVDHPHHNDESYHHQQHEHEAKQEQEESEQQIFDTIWNDQIVQKLPIICDYYIENQSENHYQYHQQQHPLNTTRHTRSKLLHNNIIVYNNQSLFPCSISTNIISIMKQSIQNDDSTPLQQQRISFANCHYNITNISILLSLFFNNDTTILSGMTNRTNSIDTYNNNNNHHYHSQQQNSKQEPNTVMNHNYLQLPIIPIPNHYFINTSMENTNYNHKNNNIHIIHNQNNRKYTHSSSSPLSPVLHNIHVSFDISYAKHIFHNIWKQYNTAAIPIGTKSAAATTTDDTTAITTTTMTPTLRNTTTVSNQTTTTTTATTTATTTTTTTIIPSNDLVTNSNGITSTNMISNYNEQCMMAYNVLEQQQRIPMMILPIIQVEKNHLQRPTNSSSSSLVMNHNHNKNNNNIDDISSIQLYKIHSIFSKESHALTIYNYNNNTNIIPYNQTEETCQEKTINHGITIVNGMDMKDNHNNDNEAINTTTVSEIHANIPIITMIPLITNIYSNLSIQQQSQHSIQNYQYSNKNFIKTFDTTMSLSKTITNTHQRTTIYTSTDTNFNVDNDQWSTKILHDEQHKQQQKQQQQLLHHHHQQQHQPLHHHHHHHQQQQLHKVTIEQLMEREMKDIHSILMIMFTTTIIIILLLIYTTLQQQKQYHQQQNTRSSSKSHGNSHNSSNCHPNRSKYDHNRHSSREQSHVNVGLNNGKYRPSTKPSYHVINNITNQPQKEYIIVPSSFNQDRTVSPLSLDPIFRNHPTVRINASDDHSTASKPSVNDDYGATDHSNNDDKVVDGIKVTNHSSSSISLSPRTKQWWYNRRQRKNQMKKEPSNNTNNFITPYRIGSTPNNTVTPTTYDNTGNVHKVPISNEHHLQSSHFNRSIEQNHPTTTTTGQLIQNQLDRNDNDNHIGLYSKRFINPITPHRTKPYDCSRVDNDRSKSDQMTSPTILNHNYTSSTQPPTPSVSVPIAGTNIDPSLPRRIIKPSLQSHPIIPIIPSTTAIVQPGLVTTQMTNVIDNNDSADNQYHSNSFIDEYW